MEYDRSALREELRAVMMKYSKRDKPERVEFVLVLTELLAGLVLLEPRDQHAVMVETCHMALAKTVEATEYRPTNRTLN